MPRGSASTLEPINPSANINSEGGENMSQSQNDNTGNQEAENIVTLSIKKTAYTSELVEAIVEANEGAYIGETEEAWQIHSGHIKTTRSEVEKAIGGKLTDAKWRILFINRQGNVNEFDNYEFSLGTPRPVQVEEAERKEYAQLNVRIEKQLKEEMERFRDLMGINQNDFVAEAVAEYIASLKKELI